MENGWIKLHRKVLKNPIVCKDAAHLAIWVYLLLNATHEDYPYLFEGRKVVLHPGQLVTGRKKLAAELDLSESKVHRVLKDFEIEQQIEQQTKAHGRLITITNWHQYQMCEQQTEQQVNNNRTTSEQELNTKQEYKEHKNKRNSNREFRKPSLEEVAQYCAERHNSVDPQKFLDYYDSNGWMVGKNHMKDWKAAVRTWERRRAEGNRFTSGIVRADYSSYREEDFLAN